MKEDVSLVEQTQRDILKYISRNGNSARLPKEQEFVELLGVSRVVVREALSRLRAVGIIETKRKKGTVVVVPEVFGVLKSIVSSGLLDKDTLRDLYQLRLMLENYGDRPVGLNTIAALTGDETATIEDYYEPYLLQLGLLERTPRGRVATSKAKAHLNHHPSA